MSSEGKKDLTFLGTSYVDLLDLPKSARREIGYQLYILQQGEDPIDWKPMKSVAAGVREIRVRRGNQYRVLYVAKFAEAIYVLHVFEKKTQHTSQRDINIAKNRFKNLTRERSEIP